MNQYYPSQCQYFFYRCSFPDLSILQLTIYWRRGALRSYLHIDLEALAARGRTSSKVPVEVLRYYTCCCERQDRTACAMASTLNQEQAVLCCIKGSVNFLGATT
ncbi:unnamed protein product [Amoebophrya sp. A120]|nr:unnamed protein product [Amoebophrya sp. A120]|eukprot:GSA120T00020708001.1